MNVGGLLIQDMLNLKTKCVCVKYGAIFVLFLRKIRWHKTKSFYFKCRLFCASFRSRSGIFSLSSGRHPAAHVFSVGHPLLLHAHDAGPGQSGTNSTHTLSISFFIHPLFVIDRVGTPTPTKAILKLSKITQSVLTYLISRLAVLLEYVTELSVVVMHCGYCRGQVLTKKKKGYNENNNKIISGCAALILIHWKKKLSILSLTVWQECNAKTSGVLVSLNTPVY